MKVKNNKNDEIDWSAMDLKDLIKAFTRQQDKFDKIQSKCNVEKDILNKISYHISLKLPKVEV